MSASCILNIALQMFEIIKELHQNKVIHRDIKLGNFMMGCKESQK